MLPFRRIKLRSIVGIDIGSTSIRMLELSHHRGQYCIEAYAHMPLFQDLSDTNLIANHIKQMHSNAHFSSKRVILAIPDPFVMSKMVQINVNVPAQDIEEWVLMEAEKCIPYPLDDICLDFNVLGPSANHSDMLDVVIVAARSRNVALRVEAVCRAGLIVQIVDVESYAQARAERWLAYPFPPMTFATPMIRRMIEMDAPLLMIAFGLALRGF